MTSAFTNDSKSGDAPSSSSAAPPPSDDCAGGASLARYAGASWRWREQPPCCGGGGGGQQPSAAMPHTESAALVEVAGLPVLVGGYFEGEGDDDDCSGGDEDEADDSPQWLSVSRFRRGVWERRTVEGVPNVEGLAAVSFGSFAVLHGGIDEDYETRGEAYALRWADAEGAAPSCLPLPLPPAARRVPLARARHAACRAGARSVAVFGGLDESDGACATLHVLHVAAGSDDGDGDVWAAAAAAAAAAASEWRQLASGPPARYNSTLAALDADGGRLALLCGARASGADQVPLSDLWVYAAGADVWREVRLATPSPRNGHVCAALPGGVLLAVCGGAGAGGGGGDDGAYDPRVLLVDAATGAVAFAAPGDNGVCPVMRYMPCGYLAVASVAAAGGGAVTVEEACDGGVVLKLAAGTKRVAGSNNVFELRMVGQSGRAE